MGDRQAGRIKADNLIETSPIRDDLVAAVARARDPEFRARCRLVVNPYAPGGDQPVGQVIKNILGSVSLAPEVLKKRLRSL